MDFNIDLDSKNLTLTLDMSTQPGSFPNINQVFFVA